MTKTETDAEVTMLSRPVIVNRDDMDIDELREHCAFLEEMLVNGHRIQAVEGVAMRRLELACANSEERRRADREDMTKMSKDLDRVRRALDLEELAGPSRMVAAIAELKSHADVDMGPLPHDLVPVLREIAAERIRQVNAEGFDAKHDAGHMPRDIANAGQCYLHHAFETDAYRERWATEGSTPGLWPWDPKWWKPKTRERDYQRGMALLLAAEQLRRRQS